MSPTQPRAQNWMKPWNTRHKKVSGIISIGNWKNMELWGWISVLPMEERRTLQKSRLFIKQISEMEQQGVFGIQRIYYSSTDTPWLLPALFNLFLLPASSQCWMFAFFPACASFQTHVGFVFNIVFVAVTRFHLKDFHQCGEMCPDKIHSVKRPKRRRMPRKGSPSAALSCGDQPLVWSGKNVTEGMSWQAESKEKIPWHFHWVKVAKKKLQLITHV